MLLCHIVSKTSQGAELDFLEKTIKTALKWNISFIKIKRRNIKTTQIRGQQRLENVHKST